MTTKKISGGNEIENWIFSILFVNETICLLSMPFAFDWVLSTSISLSNT